MTVIIWMHLRLSPASQTWMQPAVRHSTCLIPSWGAELKKQTNKHPDMSLLDIIPLLVLSHWDDQHTALVL